MKSRLSKLLAVAPVAVAVAAPLSAAAAAVDYFIKIDGIEGESTDKVHSKEIQVESFSIGVSQAAQAVSGAGAGKPVFADTAFVTRISKASPNFYFDAASGLHLKTALLSARRVGEKTNTDFYTVKLEDVVISSVKTGGSAAEVPTESVTLNFSKITWTYKPQKADGTYDTPVVHSWSLKEGKGT